MSLAAEAPGQVQDFAVGALNKTITGVSQTPRRHLLPVMRTERMELVVRRLAICVLVTLAVVAATRLAAVAQEEPTLAILVVGNSKNEILVERERRLYRALLDWRAKAGLTKEQLPIISYHFEKPTERKYCEQGLKIKLGDLLFLGVVEHKSLVAQKIRRRIYNVVEVDDSAKKAMVAVLSEMGMDVGVLENAAPPSPIPSASPSASPTVSLPRVRGVSLIRITTVDYDGQPRARFTTDDRGIYVNVYLRNEAPTDEQRHLLAVRCLDPQGRPYGRTMGGPFSVAPGERLDSVDMVRRSDPERHNGYLIKGNQIAAVPGTYQVLVEVDGQLMGRSTFELAPRTE